jgi:putative PEP-CTERM system histidine kinase
MGQALLLWTHALAALLFAGLAVLAWRDRAAGRPRRPLATALALTALWALAVAGIGGADLATRLAETLRNLAWLLFLFTLHRRLAPGPQPLALGTVYGVIAAVSLVALGLHALALTQPPAVAAPVATAVLLLRALVTVAALVLIQALHATLQPRRSGALAWVVGGLALLWLADALLFGLAYLRGDWPPVATALRGVAVIAAGLALAVGLQRGGDWSVKVSRAVTYQSLSLVAVAGYLALLALATSALASIGGAHTRILQTAFVLGSTAAILTLVSNSWLRGWVKVKLAKHLFRHRYDYRAEWMRFTETLGAPDGSAGLDERIVKAIADLTDSPAGLLLVPAGEGLEPGAGWNLAEPVTDAEPVPAAALAEGRIVALDAVRRTGQPALPGWILAREDAWALVPLPHGAALAGAILLARPAVDRALDWEDFDLLRAAGRQVASHLAEHRAQQALAEAQRFDEFNRRFAFILHDLKNLVSQLTLTARNAERHADNPAFRADMVETLRCSAERMSALLARLSQHQPLRHDQTAAVPVLPLLRRIAAARRAQHPVRVAAGGAALAVRADPLALEQLLNHLVQNAIEASPAGAPVRLELASDGAAVTIDVIDAGCGMAPGFIRDRLWKPFVSSKPDGFGLGAFEARQLAEAMGGTIAVESREGAGTRFRVRLAALAPVEQAA